MMMYIKMSNKNVSWLKSKLKMNQGFIMLNNIVMMVSLFALVISMMIILKSITTSLIFFVDNWMIQTEMQKILEDITTEITYAEKIEYDDKEINHRKIIITTRRRATISSEGEKILIAYHNNGSMIYREELARSAGIDTVISKQPLNSKSFWGSNDMQFYMNRLDDKLYKINIQAQGYRSKQQLFMQTIALQRNYEIKENGTS